MSSTDVDGAPCFAVISGGGTAGHVLPGLAVASELVRRGHDRSTIRYVGSERGIEGRLVPEAGFDLTVLPGRGIQRRLTLANVGAVIGLVRAVARAGRLLRRWRPAVVLSLGGYASAPCVLWAWLLRIPVVVAEQNAVPGLANALAGRVARVSAVSFPGVDLPRAVWTGNPVRAEVVAVDRRRDREAARSKLGIEPDRWFIAVTGGSLGARRVNEAVVGLRRHYGDRSDIAIRHVVGDRDHDLVAEAVAAEPVSGLRYDLVRYEDDMPTVLAAADVLVGRAGASTVAELAVVGLPAVLVPLPGAPGDHQTANARALAAAGGAVVLPDPDCTADRLATVLDSLLDRRQLDEMAAGASTLGRPDAAEAVAVVMEEQARG